MGRDQPLRGWPISGVASRRWLWVIKLFFTVTGGRGLLQVGSSWFKLVQVWGERFAGRVDGLIVSGFAFSFCFPFGLLSFFSPWGYLSMAWGFVQYIFWLIGNAVCDMR